MSRRIFIQTCSRSGLALFLGQTLAACGGAVEGIAPDDKNNVVSDITGTYTWLMPDESAPHKASWMAFSVSAAIWGRSGVAPVQAALARIANTIVRFEPLMMLVAASDLAVAQKLLDPAIKLIVKETDDLWMRDTGPVFVRNAQGQKVCVNFNFNGWGGKQAFAKDREVAGFIARQSALTILNSTLTLEGGGIEVDGKGTAIITESCVLNPNRNPGVSKPACEAELKRTLGIRKVIWLPGIAGKDITDGHTDFYARFVRPGVVVAGYESDPASYDRAVTQRHLDILRSAVDADNRPLQVVVIEAPAQVRPAYQNSKEFAAGYINFYVCNQAVIMSEFGDAQADARARGQLANLFPDRTVVQINIDEIAAGGGGIHCTTQQEPSD